MIIQSQRITIINLRKPTQKDLNFELQWLGGSLGLFNLRDKDKSCFRIFVELIKSAKHRIPLTSDEIAERLKLSRGTVIHHINKLMGSGLVIVDHNRYMLRVDNLTTLMDEIRKDIRRTIDDLSEAAEDLDKRLGL